MFTLKFKSFNLNPESAASLESLAVASPDFYPILLAVSHFLKLAFPGRGLPFAFWSFH